MSGKSRVLLAEDEARIAEVVRRRFGRYGHTPTWVRPGAVMRDSGGER